MQGYRGFTLIEVMLAIAITALVAVMAYSGISSAITARDVVQVQEERFRKLQLFFNLFGRDIRHLTPRPVRDAYGELEPALHALDGELSLLQLTRTGWDNPSGAPRSALQRVSWRFDGDTVYRGYWQTLDRSDDTSPREHTIIDQVNNIRVRYLVGSQFTQKGEWQDSWPQNKPDDALPLAVEVVIDVDGWGTVRRLFAPVMKES